MTLAIGWQLDSSAVLAADTLVCSTYGPTDRCDKIFRSHGVQWVCAGDLAMAQYLRAVDAPAFSGRNFERWYIKHILVPLVTIRDHIAKDSSCVLLAVAKGVLYEVSSDGCVTRPQMGYACIGSGSQYAYGYLAAEPDDRFGVFHAVAGLCESCGPEYTVWEG